MPCIHNRLFNECLEGIHLMNDQGDLHWMNDLECPWAFIEWMPRIHSGFFNECPWRHPRGHLLNECSRGNLFNECPWGHSFNEWPMWHSFNECPRGHSFNECPCGYSLNECLVSIADYLMNALGGTQGGIHSWGIHLRNATRAFI